jgi:hypothetical protein
MCTNVLIVEEEPVATALQRTLVACGFCALVVSDLAEAKKLMTTVIPDLVIFDSALSDPWDRMFGRGLVADDRTRNIPQLLLSKSDMPESSDRHEHLAPINTTQFRPYPAPTSPRSSTGTRPRMHCSRRMTGHLRSGCFATSTRVANAEPLRVCSTGRWRAVCHRRLDCKNASLAAK